MDDEIPVTILSGSLGAGKTTLLNHLLEHAGDRRIAVLVNDMGDINVDADLVSRSERAEGGVAELSNGCICCELQDDLETAVVRLAQDRDFDHLVVEPSGISEPGPVAKRFTTGSRAAARYTVDAIVTVVDGPQFHEAFAGQGGVERRGAGETGEKPLADLLVEQVELANVVVLNKCDLLTDEERETVAELVRSLRPDAEIIPTTYSAVDPDRVLGIGRYEQGRMAERAGWRQVLDESEAPETATDDGHERDQEHDHGHGHSHDHEHEHSHPQEEYGISSFAYRRRRRFHPERLADFLRTLPDEIVRSKGTLWIAGHDDTQFEYSQAGSSIQIRAVGPWIASRPEFEQDAYRRNRPNLEWDEEVGDRRNELVFIGRMDRDDVVESLDSCLLTDEEQEGEWTAVAVSFPDEPGERVSLTEPR